MADRILILDHGTAGLTGTLTQTVRGVDGSTLRAATTSGIVELAAGKYRASVPDSWSGWIEWSDGEEVFAEPIDAIVASAAPKNVSIKHGGQSIQ